MHQDTHGWLSVHDAARKMGLELDDETAWSLGALIASAWQWQTGTAPLKDLRSKKSGSGTHCFALYPPEWLPRLQEIVLAVSNTRLSQTNLFVEPADDPPEPPPIKAPLTATYIEWRERDLFK